MTVRAKVAIETDERTDRERLIVTEIPYQVNKSKLIEKIADLAQEDRVTGISDIRDESDREGVRVVIELKRNEIPLVVLNNLYKHSQLQTTFGVNMLALVNNRPEVLNLKRILVAFVEHRREVVVRRTSYELRKAEERAHILGRPQDRAGQSGCRHCPDPALAVSRCRPYRFDATVSVV